MTIKNKSIMCETNQYVDLTKEANAIFGFVGAMCEKHDYLLKDKIIEFAKEYIQTLRKQREREQTNAKHCINTDD